MIHIGIRVAAYTALAIVLAQLAYFEAVTVHEIDRFSEMGYIELSHSALLLLCTVLMCLAAWRYRELHPLPICFALFLAALAIRENDQILEFWLPHGFWKWPVTVLVAALAWFTIRGWHSLRREMLALSPTFAFGLLMAGGTTMIFSRFFGRTSFWEAVMGDQYIRIAKNAAEESVELFGIGLITAGIVETCLYFRTANDRE